MIFLDDWKYLVVLAYMAFKYPLPIDMSDVLLPFDNFDW